LKLRTEVLRKPLGLKFSEEDLQREYNDIFCIFEKYDEVIACCILTKLDEKNVKLRQMAVHEKNRGEKIGEKLLSFAEIVAKENGFEEITLHARLPATGFYLKNGYKTVGDEFIEIGIPHIKMKKSII